MTEEPYDASWDSEEDADGGAFDRKYEEWDSRDWVPWLASKLTFSFRAERMEDMDLDPLAPEEMHARNPFPVGCKVDVIGIAEGDFELDFDGVIVQIRGDKSSGCKKRKGYLPLQELEVLPKDDANYWPVREFVVWFANQ